MDKEEPLRLIVRLQEAATELGRSVIEEAAIKIGYLWRCVCVWTNTADDAACGHCGGPRPPGLAAPAPEVHILWHGVTLCGKPLDQSKWVRREEARSATCDVCICRAETYAIITH